MMQLDIMKGFISVAPLPPAIEVVGMDYNHNGIIDDEDEAMLLAVKGEDSPYGSPLRKFDLNFNGWIEFEDVEIFQNRKGLTLESIRNAIRTNTIEWLEWKGSRPWTAPLIALNAEEVTQFTMGWVTVHLHPFGAQMPDGLYRCGWFAQDTACAAYKALGFGCILRACSEWHAYNVFWTGGDWHDLHNWQVLEPQYGFAIGNKPRSAANQPSRYQTEEIIFYDGKIDPLPPPPPSYLHYCYRLAVNYDEKTVDYALQEVRTFAVSFEEPPPGEYDPLWGLPW